MKIWADHQRSTKKDEIKNDQLKCPLCRENFCTFELLELEYRNNGLFKQEKEHIHYGLECKSCKATPINGKCYKCSTCEDFYLCQACFNTDFHRQHEFLFREKTSQKYRKAARDHVGIIPSAIAQSLVNRELTDQDYDFLLQLEQNSSVNKNSSANLSQIPEKVIKSWPCERVRENSILLNPGVQCRVCLMPFKLNEQLRKLPTCKHRFHVDCIDNWLVHSHPTCPIDGSVAWDPISTQLEKEEKK
jgi:E3 ubiquitin-protein ligase ZSWIM2